MLQDITSKIKYLLVLAFLLALPIFAMPTQAVAGFGTLPIIDQTDTGVDRLIYYWDTRDRDTLFQLTNTSTSTLVVHIQIFNVGSGSVVCEEVNWDDVYTGADTHVYDIENLESNCTADGLANSECDAAPNPDLSNSYGFVSISYVSGENNAMIGLFRILDGPGGYEYRTNAAGEDFAGSDTVDFILNFNNVDGNNLSDVVGIAYEEVEFDTVNAGLLRANFGSNGGDPFTPGVPQVHIFDEFEDGTSCSPTYFDCTVGDFNRGIDNSIPNSRQADLGNRICNDSTLSETNDAGWLYLPFAGFNFGEFEEELVFFVGFLGLNNGNGTGSMDSWLASPLLFEPNGFVPEFPEASPASN